jgi:hypothetical protein
MPESIVIIDLHGPMEDRWPETYLSATLTMTSLSG